MPETVIQHNVRSESQRHSSLKKKGIKVSLTSFKNSKSSQFNISQIQVNRIVELPLMGNFSSNVKSISGQNRNRIKLNFTYQSPGRQQLNEVKGNTISSCSQSQMVIQSMKIHDNKYHIHECDKIPFQLTTFSNTESKTGQPPKGNYPLGRNIRPEVFDIVEEIVSKTQRVDKNKNQNSSVSKDDLSSYVQQQYQKNNLEMCAKQSKRQNEFRNTYMNNFEHYIRDQQGKRFYRFRKAEQKLYEIIKICDNKL